MEEEVKGYQVETCFGHNGCPNRATTDDDLTQRLEDRLSSRDLRTFLRQRVDGPLKMHHEFRVTVSDCPNACSRPQIVDLGLIGARIPRVSDEPCSQCGACVDACEEAAISLAQEDEGPVIHFNRCLSCGKCLNVCPTGTLQEAARGYRVLVGGKLGRHPQLGRELNGIYPREEALKMVDRYVDQYVKYNLKGERLGDIMNRIGMQHMGKHGKGPD